MDEIAPTPHTFATIRARRIVAVPHPAEATAHPADRPLWPHRAAPRQDGPMQALAALLDDLAFAPGEAGRSARIGRDLAAVADPDRGWGLAVLAGALELPAIGPAALHRLAEARLDPVLFALSHDFVGDLAETLALLWPDRPGAPPPPPASRCGSCSPAEPGPKSPAASPAAPS